MSDYRRRQPNRRSTDAQLQPPRIFRRDADGSYRLRRHSFKQRENVARHVPASEAGGGRRGGSGRGGDGSA